jgi:hypothetical protein
MKRVKDPELARLIREYHAAEAEADRLEIAHDAADERYHQASRDLAAHMAKHEILNDDGSLADHRSFLYEGRVYVLATVMTDGPPGGVRKAAHTAEVYKPAILEG